MTSSWFLLSTLNYDARSTTQHIYPCHTLMYSVRGMTLSILRCMRSFVSIYPVLKKIGSSVIFYCYRGATFSFSCRVLRLCLIGCIVFLLPETKPEHEIASSVRVKSFGDLLVLQYEEITTMNELYMDEFV